jgi:hypothetical protein
MTDSKRAKTGVIPVIPMTGLITSHAKPSTSPGNWDLKLMTPLRSFDSTGIQKSF